jgi:CPA1 family monovalent cation:H+ antiporter
LRGALALALVLGLPASFPNQEKLISVTFAVVTFSVIVQGLTVTPLLRRLGLIEPKHRETSRMQPLDQAEPAEKDN